MVVHVLACSEPEVTNAGVDGKWHCLLVPNCDGLCEQSNL